MTAKTDVRTFTLAVAVAVAVGAGCWIVLSRTTSARAILLAAGFAIYYARFLFALLVTLKREVTWAEVAAVAPWIAFIVIFNAFATTGEPAGIAVASGVVLYLAGSWINSSSEYRRFLWKQRPENRGRLYTGGLFRYAAHINYFGDLLLFTGLALITGSNYTLIVPVLMLAGFVFVHIPRLDSHLRQKYSPAFDEYSSRTRHLIPFVY